MTNEELEQVINIAKDHELICDEYKNLADYAVLRSREMLAGQDWVGGVVMASYAAMVLFVNGVTIENIINEHGVTFSLGLALGTRKFMSVDRVEGMIMDMAGVFEMYKDKDSAFTFFRERLFSETGTQKQIEDVIRISVDAIAVIEKSGTIPGEYIEERFDWCVDVSDAIIKEFHEIGDEESAENAAKMFTVVNNSDELSMVQKVLVYYGNFLTLKNALGIKTSIVPEDGGLTFLSDGSVNFLDGLVGRLDDDD